MKRDYLGIGLLALALSSQFVSLSLAQGKTPRAVSESAVYDLGKGKKGTKLSHPISVRNKGDAPLIIEGMRFSVPMLRVGVNRVVAPDEEANIVLELDTAELSGQVLDDIVLHTNDPQASQLSIRLQGRVQSPVEVLPRPAIYLSAFRWETGTKTGASAPGFPKPERLCLQAPRTRLQDPGRFLPSVHRHRTNSPGRPGCSRRHPPAGADGHI